MELEEIIYRADCLTALGGLADGSVDAIVTDPPYELGFMGKAWDATGITYNVKLWRECLRVLKPGGHLIAFGGTRTYHRMAVAIEDAGFEIRDMLEWVYASGFPKSLNIGKAVDKLQGNKRKSLGIVLGMGKQNPEWNGTAKGRKENSFHPEYEATKGNSEWEGFGTALKPAHEPLVLARKPLSEPTIVENVLKHGTGALDIDGCRIPTSEITGRELYDNPSWKNTSKAGQGSINDDWKLGRFPANVLCTDDALNDGVIEKGCFGGNAGVLNNSVYGKYKTKKIIKVVALVTQVQNPAISV